MDTASLFGLCSEYNDFIDDALARILDKVYAAGSSNLFSKIALNSYSAFDIPFHNLHSDTTSISLLSTMVLILQKALAKTIDRRI